MGRPPTGLRPGERLSDYKRITVRLPPCPVGRIETLAGDLQITPWRVMVQALDAYADAQAEMNAGRARTG
jgi:predicted transcriptional regulator